LITLKHISFDDLSDLSELYNELIGKKTNYTKLINVFERIQTNENYIILGAFNDDKLVGSLMGIICHDLVGECRPFMVVENVIVSHRARRQGIGKKLMLEIERITKERDCYYMIFVSGEQRKEAHEFYEKLGFKEENVEGYRKHFF
jgi:GNAT superfamily N-acetyltransferase